MSDATESANPINAMALVAENTAFARIANISFPFTVSFSTMKEIYLL